METIERLRRHRSERNAIICSGYSDEAALSEFLSYGFRGALPKPFTRRELADAMRKAGHRRAALDRWRFVRHSLAFRELLEFAR